MDFATITDAVEIGFEVAGLLALIIGALIAFVGYFTSITRGERGGQARNVAYRTLRAGIGRAILLGLELLVAADIVRSIAIDPTFTSVGVLGLIVVVRTFLSWSLEVEISGEWPWRRAASRTPAERETAL